MSALANAVAGREIAALHLAAQGESASLPAGPPQRASNGLVSELRGVPKGTLRAVLGSALGSQVWEAARSTARFEKEPSLDAEVVAGLIGHLARRAAAELRAHQRHAKFVRLTAYAVDGASASERARLPGLTQDADEIVRVAVRLFKSLGLAPAGVCSLSLDVTVASSTVCETCPAPAWQAALAAC